MEGLWVEEGSQTSYVKKDDCPGPADDLILSQRAWKEQALDEVININPLDEGECHD